jgi:hypothetical protein
MRRISRTRILGNGCCGSEEGEGENGEDGGELHLE